VLWVDRTDIKRILTWTWSFHVVASLAIAITVMIRNQSSWIAIPGINVCTGTIKGAWAVWLPVMIFHLVIFGLVSARAWYTPRDDPNPFLRVLLIDGFLFSGVIFSLMFINLVIWAINVPSLAELPHYSIWAFSTTAITRLLLSLQKRLYNNHITALKASEQSRDTSSIYWARVPSAVGSPLDDPFYAYYTAPFPMLPEIEPSTKRCSCSSIRRRTMASTQSANYLAGRGRRDENDDEAANIAMDMLGTPRTKDLPLVPSKDLPAIPIKRLPPVPPIVFTTSIFPPSS